LKNFNRQKIRNQRKNAAEIIRNVLFFRNPKLENAAVEKYEIRKVVSFLFIFCDEILFRLQINYKINLFSNLPKIKSFLSQVDVKLIL